jgi:chemotaxis protein CheX
MDLQHDDVIALVSDIWSAMTGIEVASAAPAEIDGTSLTGFVHINGGWQGTVTLRCPAPLAAEAAAAMFGMDLDELGDEEIGDALGELTNMTGGGIKAMLPGPSQLSLPAVVAGGEYSVAVPGAAQLAEMHFTAGDARIAVRVLQGEDAVPAPTAAASALA